MATKVASVKPEGVTFHRVPAVITNQGKFWQELTEERRTKWLSAISRADLTPNILENDRVCKKHFKSGKPAKVWDKHNEDWVPTQHLVHSKQQVKNPEAATERANRTAERRKRIQESAQQQREKKLAKLNEPGETVKHIFMGSNLDSRVFINGQSRADYYGQSKQ